MSCFQFKSHANFCQSSPFTLNKVKRWNNIDQSYVYVDNLWEKSRCLILILVKKAEKRKANNKPTDPETPRKKEVKGDDWQKFACDLNWKQDI
jgi:hypothetical protein